jgi:hypothetical protein
VVRNITEGDKVVANTVFIHVNRIWTRGLCFRVGIDFSRTKPADVVSAWTTVAGACKAELLIILGFCFIEEPLISFEALSSCPANKWCYCPPLSGHELCKVQELLVFGLR